MSEKFICAEIIEISVHYAYKTIRNLNQELADKDFITVTGRVNREYFNERIYNSASHKEDNA